MKRKKKTKKSSKQWGGLPAIPGLKLGRDFVARMCSLSAYPMFLVNYAIEHNLPLCERNHLISAYKDEYLEFLSLMKDFCADELNIHAIQDRVDLYKEWDALYLRYSDWLKEMLGNKSVNLNDANLVKDKEQLWTSLALFNKTALYGRISKRELETKINKIISRTDVSKLPVNVQNFIKEADFDHPLLQDPVTGELVPFEGKKPLYLNGMKLLKRQLERKKKTKSEKVILIDDEFTIMYELNENPQKTQTTVEISAATPLRQRTVGRRLVRLEKVHFVHRPNGPRKGWSITPKGQSFLKQTEN